MKRYAVIPTRNRGTWIGAMIETLVADDVHVVVVNNGEEPIPNGHLAQVVQWPMQPPNLSIIWNVGLDVVDRHHWRTAAGEEYIVAVLNDDLGLPEHFVSRLEEFMDIYHAAAAYPDQHGYGLYTLAMATTGSPDRRMCGYAFALRGSLGLRADPSIKWWYGDDDLDWQARIKGGIVCVPGVQVTHYEPNLSTSRSPELSEQAGRDRETFINKWGVPPW